MKLCPKCDQPVAEEITTCPSCGSSIVAGRKYIDDYRIVDILHEGHASLLCRAIRERTQELVMIRLFTDQAGVDAEVANRLEAELEELKKLPPEGFVNHYAIRKSSDGLWYRTSEWINSESWGSLLASGRLSSLATCIDLFHRMATILAQLHQQGHIIPHLILNDIIIVRDDSKQLNVKIDYKLSRFFDPKLDRPGPMLKKLLGSHPDIVNQRPFDFQTDIWSLGKIFVELLTADLEIDNYLGKIDELDLPGELEVLLKVMLADDPDIRPHSMDEVAASLARIKKSCSDLTPEGGQVEPSAPVRSMVRLSKMVKLLGLAVVLLCVFGVFSWYRLGQRPEDTSVVLEQYANRYAPSVAFLVTEYWVEVDNIRYYSNVAEGTAFLADAGGYLLTGRHVVCPWLEDPTFLGAVGQLRLRGMQPKFGYRIFLWFDGQKAFNRGARMLESPELTDIFSVETAFRTDGEPYLSIAGVAKPPLQTRQLITSPLRDDFAVLKIDHVPEGLQSLPLAPDMDPQKIPRMSPVIALGFPLGRRTQADIVNVSVTAGHVRRTFENLIHIDASIYGGNSGGPIIDSRGYVIGIVAGVAMDWLPGGRSIGTPMWDLGMVMPITNAVSLLGELKTGHVKWNGLVDFSAQKKVLEIREKAEESQWAQAVQEAEKALKENMQPSLVTAAAMMHFCVGDYRQAKKRFAQALSIDGEDYQARLMLYLIDWLTGMTTSGPHGRHLLQLNWQSAAEFQGYLAAVLKGDIDEQTALEGWYDDDERSWLHYVVALRMEKSGRMAQARRLLKESVLSAELDSWVLFLARARLSQLQKLQRASLRTKEQWASYNAELEEFRLQVKEDYRTKQKIEEQLEPFVLSIGGGAAGLDQRLALLEKMISLMPSNRSLLAALAYAYGGGGRWESALDYARSFLLSPGRENARRLGMELLEAGIMKKQGKEDEARQYLERYQRQTTEDWFITIVDCLLGKESETALRTMAGESPEKLLTAFTYLGFWEEGGGERDKAINHYKEALESFLDDWFEYNFARERIKTLRIPVPEQQRQ
ncbi:trypsin-like peptidase domain-containing protein [Desulforhopalus singaporensis]|uniref:Protein kinase domain-containing protein n=1 Tax=Desulforhopalus singaporensis TaxID=91360 RepID=A0A1H0U3U7_9BACT|nr:trypsin-like peptidase domain-containing protein [Desulforhopalus singaporensis]SDP60675.1 Protein kinase domain-containing protein [Desulforhopalus singaporensis]